MPLAVLLAAIGPVGSGLFAHRGLARQRPSVPARVQSIWTSSCCFVRKNVLCRRWPWPDKRAGAVDRCSRCRSRSSCGRSSLRIPVCNTKGMPSGAAWSSTRAGPPLGDTVACGNSDPSVLRSVLLIFFLALPNTTDQRAGQWHGRSGRSNWTWPQAARGKVAQSSSLVRSTLSTSRNAPTAPAMIAAAATGWRLTWRFTRR